MGHYRSGRHHNGKSTAAELKVLPMGESMMDHSPQYRGKVV